MNATTLQACLSNPGVKLYVLDAILNATSNITCQQKKEKTDPYLIGVFVFTLTIIIAQIAVYITAFIRSRYEKYVKEIRYKVNNQHSEPV